MIDNYQPKSFLQIYVKNMSQEIKNQEHNKKFIQINKLSVNVYQNINSISNNNLIILSSNNYFEVQSANQTKKINISFQIKNIEDGDYYKNIQINQDQIQLTYVIATEEDFIMGTNYGVLLSYYKRNSIKIHTNIINYISTRNQYLLTCSEDGTACVLKSHSFQHLHILKDKFHLKQAIQKGEFIDDYKLAICSRGFIKVYVYQYGNKFHIQQTLLTIQISYTQNIFFSGDLAFVNNNNKMKLYLLEDVSKPIKEQKQIVIKVAEYEEVQNFCLLENLGFIKQIKTAFIFVNFKNDYIWSLNKKLVKELKDKQLPCDEMVYNSGYLYLLYISECIRIKIEVPQ